MIICEIGLNHLGDEEYALEYVSKILSTDVDAITFQIRESDFYVDTYDSFILSDNFYRNIVEKIKNSNVLIGIALSDIKKIPFFDSLNIDFFKILSKDFKNNKLISEMLKTKKHIYISTGTVNELEISNFINNFSPKKSFFTLIHTQMSYNIEDVNLKAISILQKKFQLPVAYGNHSHNYLTTFVALGFEPSDIFIYVKGNKNKSHPDEVHSIPLENLETFVHDLKELKKSIGHGVKNITVNTITD